MQDWKMTDEVLANSERNYGVWKMQDWKMTDRVDWRLMFFYLLRSRYDCVFVITLFVVDDSSGILSETP